MVKRRGVWFLLNKHNWIDNRLLCFRVYEKANLAVMHRLIDEKQIDYFFDIGANIGYYTTILTAKTRIKHTYAYEPMLRNYYQLCANVLLNDLTGRTSCYANAIGDKNHTLELWYNPYSTGIATLNRDATPRAKKDYTVNETVKCMRFDDLHTMEISACW